MLVTLSAPFTSIPCLLMKVPINRTPDEFRHSSASLLGHSPNSFFSCCSLRKSAVRLMTI